MNNNIVKLQAYLRRRKIDGMLITEPSNRRYLSGYTAPDHGIQETSGVLLVPAKGAPFLLTDSRFLLQAEEEASGYIIRQYKKGLFSLLQQILPADAVIFPIRIEQQRGGEWQVSLDRACLEPQRLVVRLIGLGSLGDQGQRSGHTQSHDEQDPHWLKERSSHRGTSNGAAKEKSTRGSRDLDICHG